MRPGEFERKVGTNLDQRTWDRLLRQVSIQGETKGVLLRIAIEELLSRLEQEERLADLRRPARYNDRRRAS